MSGAPDHRSSDIPSATARDTPASTFDAAYEQRVALWRRCVDHHGMGVARALQSRYRNDPDGLTRAFNAALGVAVEQPIRASREVDHLTVLGCTPRSAAKARERGGQTRAHKIVRSLDPLTIDDFDAGWKFRTLSWEVAGLAGLAEALAQLERERDLFVVRGRAADDAPTLIRRTLHRQKSGEAPHIKATPRRWLALDFDSIPLPADVSPIDVEAVGGRARTLLPVEFHDVGCYATLTSSAGLKAGGRVRLFFWLDAPARDIDLVRWLKSAPVDRALFVANTPIYTATPVFAPGITDPVPRRSTLLAGGRDVVHVPPIPAPASAPAPAEARAYQRPRRLSFRSTRSEKYMLACLHGVARAGEGDRHRTIVSVSARLFGLAKAGHLDPADVAARVKGAVAASSFDRDMAEVDSALTWAWQHAEPWELR